MHTFNAKNSWCSPLYGTGKVGMVFINRNSKNCRIRYYNPIHIHCRIPTHHHTMTILRNCCTANNLPIHRKSHHKASNHRCRRHTSHCLPRIPWNRANCRRVPRTPRRLHCTGSRNFRSRSRCRPSGRDCRSYNRRHIAIHRTGIRQVLRRSTGPTPESRQAPSGIKQQQNALCTILDDFSAKKMWWGKNEWQNIRNENALVIFRKNLRWVFICFFGSGAGKSGKRVLKSCCVFVVCLYTVYVSVCVCVFGRAFCLVSRGFMHVQYSVQYTNTKDWLRYVQYSTCRRERARKIMQSSSYYTYAWEPFIYLFIRLWKVKERKWPYKTSHPPNLVIRRIYTRVCNTEVCLLFYYYISAILQIAIERSALMRPVP